MTQNTLKTKFAASRFCLFFQFRHHAGLPLLFLLLIFLPLADMVLKISQPMVIKEKRKLSAKPVFALREPFVYLKKYEAYFNDHFGFRSHLLHAHHRLTYEIFRQSPSPKVIVGRQGWLFLNKADERNNEFDYYRNRKPFTTGELARFTKLLEQRRDWLARRGIHYLFVVAPNKSTIYPEFLPAAVRKAHERSRLDQLIEYVQTHSSLRLLDLRPLLLGEKTKARIYHKTDTHWNNLGGYFAYREIILYMRQFFKNLEPVAMNNFTTEQVSKTGGDLAIMMSLQQNPFREMHINVHLQNPLRARPAAPTPGFHPKAPWIRMNATQCPSGQIPVAVMVRDSFATQLHPFLSENFKRIVYIWDWNLHFFLNVIEKEKPQIVIDQMAERTLSNPMPINPDELLAQTQGAAEAGLNPR